MKVHSSIDIRQPEPQQNSTTKDEACSVSPSSAKPNVTGSAISEAFFVDCEIGMKQHKDYEFDLAICDIPYGIGVGKMAFLTETNTSVKQKNGTRLNPNRNKEKYEKSNWDNEVPTQQYFDELKRISRNQIIFGIEYTNWTGIGNGRIKWDKGFNEKVSFKRYETAYCSLIDEVIELPLLWAGMQQAKSLKEPMKQQGNKKLNEKRIHPCHKPILLYKDLLMRFAKENDKIIDTHLGSGSSRIACYDFGLSFVGYENNKRYFEKQEQRFKQHINQLDMFRNVSQHCQ
jgi:site-specific DNA-methyltransferase (adenine-specific)